MTDVRVTPTRYEVSVLPVDFEEAYHWTITVEYRGYGLYAIIHSMQVYGKDGTWDSDSRTLAQENEEWRLAHRFPLDEALEIAKKLAPVVTIGTRFGPMNAYDAMAKKERDGYV
jgi:hypothetical protein